MGRFWEEKYWLYKANHKELKIVAAVYSHPEYYPPTLNAVNALAASVEHIEMVCRNVKMDEITYNKNITLKKSGLFKNIRATETASNFWKLKSFLHFTALLFQTLRKTNPKWLIAYDPIPLLSYRLIRPFLLYKPKLWYHNHDVLEMHKLKKYSISWFAYKSEQNSFNKIDLFTLPSEKRKIYFPIHKLKGQYLFLPNYPSINLLNLPHKLTENKPLKLIYQGNIDEGHGLAEIIEYVGKRTVDITLTLIGNIDLDYERHLKLVIKQSNLTDRIKLLSPLPYEQLIPFTSIHHIGLAINKPINIQYQTGSTASNKIYEYIACGLPVFLYDNNEYRSKLKERKWAFFTDLTFESIDKNITNIVGKYSEISESAIHDFKGDLHFEKKFSKVLTLVMSEE